MSKFANADADAPAASRDKTDRPAAPADHPDIDALAREHLIQPWPIVGKIGRAANPMVDRADGIYVDGPEGRKLIDGPGGMWCVQIGHRRREIADAMTSQIMDHVGYASPWYTTTAPAARLAARIAEMTPGDLNHVFFTTGGSTAVDSAMRFVQFYNNVIGRPEKKIFISRGDAYHGSTYLSASACGKMRDKNYMDEASEIVHRLSSPNPFWRPAGLTIEAFTDQLVQEFEDKILQLGAHRVAAFIAEPILASGGCIVPPEGYHKRMEAICRRHDVLFIADEVVTAFGRLGHWFASKEVFDTEPDIITFAKGVTSGYVPLGGFAVSHRLIEQTRGEIGDKAMFSNGFTYSSHPVCCAAALANIGIIEREGLLEHTREIAPYFQSRLRELEALPLVGEVRGIGLMAGVECVANRDERSPLVLDRHVGSRIDAHCVDVGLIVRPLINACVMSPPLIIEKAQIDQMVEMLAEGILRTQNDLRREGVWNA